MPYADWAGVREDLSRALEELADCEFLVLGEHVSRTPRRRGLFGGRPTSPGPAAARYVQALRVEDVFSAECVGAVSQGGTWEMSEATIEELRALGWLTPAEARSAYGSTTPNFALYAGPAVSRALAGLMVASLALLGTTPSGLVLEVSGRGQRAVGD